MAIVSTRAVVKLAINAVKGLPGVSNALRSAPVRAVLSKVPGGSFLLQPVTHPWDRVHPYDRVHGTDTSGFGQPPIADPEPDAPTHPLMNAYAGSQPSIVRALLKTIGPLDSFTFIDFGCGKGRPLLVASEFPFRDIIGIDLSEPLAAIARANAARIRTLYPDRTPVRIVVGDATRFPLPPGNLVLFLYNPFGEELTTALAHDVVAALADASRTIYIFAYNPVLGRVFDSVPQLRRHTAATLPYAPEEIGFGPDAEDPVVIWHGGRELTPPHAGADARIELVDPRWRPRLVHASP